MKKLLVCLSVLFLMTQVVNAQLDSKMASTYTHVYSDHGTGADMDISIWKPEVPLGYFSLGYVAKTGYEAPSTAVFVVRPTEDFSVIAYPVDYVLVWNDAGSGGNQDGAIWEPVAPEGYVAMGTVATNGYAKPNLKEVVCVRVDLVTEVSVGSLIWTDTGSGADNDVSIWGLQAPTGKLAFSGSFCASNSYAKPTSSKVAYAIKY